MLEKKDFIKIGNIQKPHGIKGEVILNFDFEIAEEIEGQQTIFIEIDGGLVPFFVSGYRNKNTKSAIVLFDLVRTQEEIQEITGCPVFTLKKEFPFLTDNEYGSELVGMLLYDTRGKYIGNISEFIFNPQNPLLKITPENQKEKEILLPFNEELIRDFDPKKGRLIMDLPDGILEL